MPQDDTLDLLDVVASESDSAENGVVNVKKKVKAYSERLNADREKIRTEIDTQYKSNLSKLLGVEVKDLTQEEIDNIIKLKIEDSDVVKEANRIIEENNNKLVEQAVTENINKIKTLNPNIDSLEKLTQHEQYADIEAKVNKGYDLYDAYISIVGITSNSGDGVNPTQRKSIDSKTIAYVAPETINEGTLANYRRAFPNKTDAELIEMYRRDNQ